jgi:hypothetical protein
MPRESASNAFVLQIGMKPFGEQLVLTRVADKTRIKFDRVPA